MFRWVDGDADGSGQKRPGKIHFPDDFNGEIFTEVNFKTLSISNKIYIFFMRRIFADYRHMAKQI